MKEQAKVVKVDCFNCSETGYFSSDCPKNKLCHICKKIDHNATQCPEWEKPLEVAEFYGSANSGLGFFHIDVEDRPDRHNNWVQFENCAIIGIEEGEMSKEGVVASLQEIFDEDWNWQLKQIDDYSYITRFPPHKKLREIVHSDVIYFPLSKEGVLGFLKIWDGEIEAHGELVDTWVQVRGIPPKWSDWITFQQISSMLGKLVEIDWGSQITSFFSMIRIKIAVKDPYKIPKERLVVMRKKLYWLSFKVEGDIKQEDDDDGGDEKKDGSQDDKAFDAKEDKSEMDTDHKTPNQQKHDNSRGNNNIQGNQESRGTKIVSMWTSLFRDSYLDEMFGEDMSNFNSFNLLREMDLVASESEEEQWGEEMEGILEDSQPLPEIVVQDLIQNREKMVVETGTELEHGRNSAKEDLPIGWSCLEDNEIKEQQNGKGRVEDLKAMEGDKMKKQGEKRKPQKQKWAPMLVERRSTRNRNGEGNILEKAQSLKMKNNLELHQEKPKGVPLHHRGRFDAGVSKQMVRFAAAISKESVVDVEGVIALPKEPLKATTQQVEIQVRKIYCISRAIPTLPFSLEDAARSEAEFEKAEQAGEKLVRVGQDTRLNHRCLDLRTAGNQAIIRIKGQVKHKFGDFLLSKDFVEIETTKLTAGSSEGGAAVFKLQYYGQPACLAQSPQLYKQMSINGGFGRVFEVGPVYRAENSNTHRHLSEFIGLDAEMEIMEHYFEVCDIVGELFVSIFKHLTENCKKELETINRQYPFEPLKYLEQTLKLTYEEGIQMLKEAGMEVELMGDLNTEAEKKLGRLVKEKYGTDFFILYRYPSAVRPFYTMPCCENPAYSNSFDAFIRGEEIISGAQRIHMPELLTKRAAECGIDTSTISAYVNSFCYGAPPHAGFGWVWRES